MTLVGWAPDGFPIYARNGYTVASDANSGLKALASSYRLKTTPDANRPATGPTRWARSRRTTSTFPAWAIWTNATAAAA